MPALTSCADMSKKKYTYIERVGVDDKLITQLSRPNLKTKIALNCVIY